MDFKTIDPAKIIHNKELRNQFVKVYNASGLGTLKECDNCAGAFENAILKYQKKHLMSLKNYELFPNKVLHFQGKDYVNANLTDEVAAAAVAAGHASKFKRIPSDVHPVTETVIVKTKGRKRKS